MVCFGKNMSVTPGTTVKSGSKIKFTEMENVLCAQISQYYKAKFFQNPGTSVDKNQYTESMLGWVRKSAPEFLYKMSEDRLPFVLVLPRTFVSCKKQMELIEKARSDQVTFNEMAKKISIKTGEKIITIQDVDFSTFHNMASSSQPIKPYLIFRLPSLEELQKRLKEFSSEEILAIIFHCANAPE